MNALPYIAAGVSLLAIGGYVWYTLRNSAQLSTQNQELTEDSKVKDAKIKTLDDRIIDSEYRTRAQEKLNEKTATAATAANLLTKAAGHDDN